MEKSDLKKLAAEIEKENKLFKHKGVLDVFSEGKILGREDKTKELLRFLLSYKQGYAVPFVSVYGRSGSGKSTVVRFVCDNTPGMLSCFVNLRKAKTIFGCANLVLAELGQPNLKSAQGLNTAVEAIMNSVLDVLSKSKDKLFVLVLDEFDSLFGDKRNSPSEFLYKLLTIEEKIRKEGHMMCIIGISNNVISEYELDDRVLSRIGSSEVFFEPYSKKQILEILKDKAKVAFAKKIPDDVLQYSADLGSSQHGDVRRAIDLLRTAGELAQNNVTKKDLDNASDHLQKDRVSNVINNASYHQRVVCAAVIKLAYTDKEWNSTSEIYGLYQQILGKDSKPLSYRRVSGLLVDLANTGILLSSTISRGRSGYGTQFKPVVDPDMIGKSCFGDWWKDVVDQKIRSDAAKKLSSIYGRRSRRRFRFDSLLDM